MTGRDHYEDYVRRHYERFPPGPGDRLCPPWEDIEPEARAKWDELAALMPREPEQGALAL